MKDTYCINDNKNTYGKQEGSGGEQAGPFTDRAIPHNSKCRYGERGAADAGAVLKPQGGNCAVLS
jgi:hypothetical protein